jgi:hypothetical protein
MNVGGKDNEISEQQKDVLWTLVVQVNFVDGQKREAKSAFIRK